ncbi:pseudouridine synthase [Myxococcus sp. CA051A]|uniref:pseudouridine synthase n=1 Tax=Myxococcus sp. CA051A TaxID=2741739 RepID=UPI00157B9708|nr:pseudouridine synthase [Myxococcus sp. CA051A]NTX66270.1 pseudouridine synthase [Myxococcus sp. CA051A]
MSAERLQKYLARAGVASRRHAEELITAGRVAVNNTTVTELGSRVEPGTDLVSVDGKLVTPPEESSYFLLYKPVGVVTTLSDPQGRPTVANYLEETGKRLFPVGRLDYDAEGALLFTDDGALAHKLTHPSFQVPRTYLAKVKGEPDILTLDKLRGGVRLEDGMATPVSVGVFESAEKNTWLKIVVAEGRPHLIKRLCAAVGHPVVRLFRPAYAGIGVEGLRPGALRPLKKAEVELLNDVAEGRVAPPTAELRLPPRRHGRAAPGFNESDEDELSMDDDAPAPRKAAGERGARKAPAGAGGAAWKPVVDGGSGLARFGRPRGAAAEGRGARRSGGDEGERPSRGAGRPARKEWGAGGADSPRSRGPRAEGGADRGPPRRAPAAGGASRFGRSASGDEGRPARKEWGAGGEDSPRTSRSAGAGEGRPARKEWSADGESARGPARRGAVGDSKPRFGGDSKPRFGGDSKPRFGGEGKSRFGGDSKPRFGGEGKPRFGGDSKPRFGGEGKPRFGGDSKPRFDGESKPRFGGDSKPRFGGEGKPRFGGDSKPRFGGEGKPRFGGDSKPRFDGESKPRFGGDSKPRFGGEGKPRFGGDSTPRFDGESKPRFGGDSKPRFGGDSKPRFGGDSKPRFGGDSKPRFGGDSKPRFGGDSKPRFGGDSKPRFGGDSKPRFGGDSKPRFGGDSKPRFGGDSKPRFGGEGKPRFGGAGRSEGEGRPRFGGGASRGAGRSASAGEGRPPRREWSGGDKGAPRGRPDRKPRDSEGSGPRGRSGGFGAKPGGKGPRGAGGRTEARAWKPYDDKGAPRERVVRAGSRGLAPEGARKSEGFQDWGKKKEAGSRPRFSTQGPKGRAGSSSKGPRRPY